MTCTACFIQFLDLAPGLRDQVNNFIDFNLELPLGDFQAELVVVDQFLNDLDAKLNEWTGYLNETLSLNAAVDSAMISQGINPGDCPQIDSFLSFVDLQQLFILNSITNPFTKMLGMVQNLSVNLSADIAVIQSLLDNVNSFKC